VPDENGLRQIADALQAAHDGALLDTTYHHRRATLIADPARIRDVLTFLREGGYRFLASLHGVDYYPHEPRLGVLYELLDMDSVDRISVKARLHTAAPQIDSVVDLFPTADFQEREVFDMFGVEFQGHPDLRRILMPEDYEGFPERRDFPVGGEPILFTFNEQTNYGRWL
jgi:NADH-quinone oxidoreductase subunit C